MDGFNSPFLQVPSDFLSLFEGNPSGDELAGADPDHQRVFLSDNLLAAADYLLEEAKAPGKGSSVTILASVGERRKKLVDKIAVGGMDENGIKTGGERTPSRLAEGFD
jgi:hypothetical protein